MGEVDDADEIRAAKVKAVRQASRTKFQRDQKEARSVSRLAGREEVEHFGVKFRSGFKYGFRIDRATYAQPEVKPAPDSPVDNTPSAEPPADTACTDWETQQRQRALRNLDRNMTHFSSLDHDEFERVLSDALGTLPGMEEVPDLEALHGVTGLYVMVLDDYCQAYVGKAEGAGGIGARIRQHWTARKPLERLIWGDEHTSILSVDSFGPLDTTRIFVSRMPNPAASENDLIDAFPRDFLLNRAAGGDVGFDSNTQSVPWLAMRIRDFQPGIER